MLNSIIMPVASIFPHRPAVILQSKYLCLTELLLDSHTSVWNSECYKGCIIMLGREKLKLTRSLCPLGCDFYIAAIS